MPQVDMKISRWYIQVALPNAKDIKFRPLYECYHNNDIGKLRVANDEDLENILPDEIMFFDTYNQAENFASKLTQDFGYYTRIDEYVT